MQQAPVFRKYASALSVFDKSISPAQARVGELVTTTISANLFGNYFYTTTILSDALPTGLGYRSSELVVASDVDGGAGGPYTNTITLPYPAPELNQSGDVIWSLGTLTGQVRISGIITAVVQNVLSNQDGVTLTNRARLTYVDDGQPYEFDDEAPTAVIEPDLVIEKSVSPQYAKPGDTVFYTIRLYHSAASHSPAYNVTITDVVPAGLAYLSGSWDQALGPDADMLDDNASPLLQAFWNEIPLTVTQANPIQLRYSAAIGLDEPFGSLFVNTARTQWTSLPDDPAGETRDGSGGVNDYNTSDDAEVALSDVSVLKTGPLTVTAGSVITYRITGVNVGPYPAVDAHVVDTMPFQVHSVEATYQVGAVSGACSVTQPGDYPIVDCAISAIPVGVNVTVLITGVVDADTPEGADLTNTANITVTTPDGNTTNNEVSVETEVYTEGDLSVDKTGPLTATAGALITYTVVLNNGGPSTSRSVDVKDILPPGVTWVGGSSSQGACVNGICQLGDVLVGQPVTMVITGLVGSDVTGLITNTAQSFPDTRDPNPGNDRDTWGTDVSALTALRVDKVDLTDPVYAGDTYFYEIVVTNTGPSVAENVVLVDTLPGEVTFEGTSPECSVAGGAIMCLLGRMLPGEVRDFLVNVRVDPNVANNTVGMNTVNVTSTTPIDLANSVLSDSEPTTYLTRVGGPLDLQLTKTVMPSAVINGGQVTYTLVVTNDGPSAASAVQVVDAFPREFDFVRATTSKDQGLALCSNGVVCDLGVMAVDEMVEITLVFDVPSDVARQVYTNTAHVSSPAPESNYTNNTSSAPVSVSDVANLQIRKVATPDPAEPGGPLQYNITVSNSGPSDAENVTVSDVLPTGFIPTMILPSQGDCNAFPCNLGTIAAGGNASILVVGTVAPTVVSATEIQNTATVTSTTPGSGGTDTASPALDLVADLEVVKTGTATAVPGEIVTYTVSVHNLGPGTASQVRMTDTLPAGLTYAGVSDVLCSPSGNQIVCIAGDLAPQVMRQYVISATVGADVPPGTSLQNTATAAGVGYRDPNAANNSANADTSIIGAADLVIDKRQVNPSGTVTAGELVTYVVTITNTGPGLARSVDVKDQLPPGMTLERISADDGVCGGAVCQFGTLAVDATRTVTVVARVGEDVTAGSLVNVAGVFSADDPDPTEADQDQVETPIDQEADITVNKVDLIDPVSPGGGLLYQITVRNDGPSTARNVIVTDTLDVNVTFAGASPGCALNGDEVVCTVGDLASGEVRTFLIAANASQSVTAGQTLVNTVIATSTTFDPTPENTDIAETTVVGARTQADVGIEKTTAASAVIAGERITYTLSVTNAGPAAATNVRVLELVPTGTTVVSMATVNPNDASAYCSLGGACYLGTIISGTMALITVTLDVAPDFEGTTLVNTAHVSADQADPNTANNIADETTPVQQSADVSVVKSDLPDPVSAGEVLLYQILARNDGPSLARNVTVTDTFDANLAYVGSSPGCSVSGNLVTCLIGDLAPGETRSVFMQGRVDPDLVQNVTLNNNVIVGSDTPDPYPDNNSFDEPTDATVGALPPTDLTIAKDATPVVIAGELVTYTLVVTNLGPTSASGVHVVDALPAGVQAESVTSSQGTCNLAGVCLLGALEVSGTIEITFVVRVDSAQTADLLNVARVAASNPELNEANNVDDAGTIVTTADNLSILKTGSTQVTPGGVIAYQIVVHNAGPSDATNVVISDTLPLDVVNATAAASRGGCSIAADLVTCTVGRLAPGESVVVVINGQVASACRRYAREYRERYQ